MSKVFPTVGVVEAYCNIHPEMAATILVLPNRRFTTLAGGGAFRIVGVPPGKWVLYAYSRRAAEPVSAPIEVLAGRTVSVALVLSETRFDFSHRNKYGELYRDLEKYR